MKLLDDLVHKARANGSTALADSEAETLLDSDRRDQTNGDVKVVTGLRHISTAKIGDNTGHVSGAEVELRTIVGEEGLLTAAFLLRKDVNLANILLNRWRNSYLSW